MKDVNPTPYISAGDVFHFALRWTPRAIFAGVAGYYSLGVAYDKGVMAAIDRVAIRIFRHFWGYAGIGTFMPTFQWYAAWGVRILSAFAAGILYDLVERILLAAYRVLKTWISGDPELIPLHGLAGKNKESDKQDILPV